MTTANHISEIRPLGQSVWMDNLTRDLIESGELKRLIEERDVRGITSNPAIFEKAIVGNAIYDADIEAGIRAGKSVQEIYESLVFEDIRHACDIFQPIYQESNGLDGYISIEVPPNISHDTEKTIQEARRYFSEIGRPNVMVKIPGTSEGLPAVEQVISEGMNVNVTLLFSVDSYLETAWAYIRGLENRAASGQDISHIASVASFFLSRIDSKIDDRIEATLKQGVPSINEEAKLRSILGKVAIANAKIAYEKYQEIIQTDRWKALAEKGAKVQRLLWASTSTKNPHYNDVMYVDELIGPDTVNTLPPNTIEACADHCDVADRIGLNLNEAHTLLDTLKDPDVDIDLNQVMAELLSEGIDKFIQPFESLMESLKEKVDRLASVA
ncbi:MAG: transaldolase [Leptolyngbyaceae cyanobacterium bins.59]|nr:transaldolase [Leptolyngbyaceae cyanobacterium bins.59]